MQAIRIHPNPDRLNPYSAENPAPPSALKLDSNIPIPQPLKPGELLIKVEASTVVRDTLIWPETYAHEYAIPGNDFAGTVVAVSEASGEHSFKPGDEVYGMSNAARAGVWAEYTIVLETETSLKPKGISGTEAAAVPLSALTAYQALFIHAGVSPPDFNNLPGYDDIAKDTPVLITGASGCVGLYLVRLAKLAGLHVVAATRSNARNEDYLKQLGASEVVEYSDLSKHPKRFQTVIDSVGGQTLEGCWHLVRDGGTIISIESASYDFVEQHKKSQATNDSTNIKGIWFIVEPLAKHLMQLSVAIEARLLEPFVADIVPWADAQHAYESSASMPTSRGKIVLSIGSNW